jgi:glycogenin glucosyltransferase
VVDAGSDHSFAFVTSVYDDATCDATQVMLYSLVMSQTVAQLVVLTLKGQLGQECTDALRTLGALVKEVDPIASPSGKSTQLYNQHLRFTKLLVWGMVEYKKVILIDSDMVVLKNIDHLFQRSDLSAVEDPGAPGMFNSGLMVISPSTTLLAEMLEALPNAETYNGGDQGFLNSFFESKWRENFATLRLPAIYNAFPRMKRYASWESLLRGHTRHASYC